MRGSVGGYLICLCDMKIILEQEFEELHIELICNLPYKRYNKNGSSAIIRIHTSSSMILLPKTIKGMRIS